MFNKILSALFAVAFFTVSFFIHRYTENWTVERMDSLEEGTNQVVSLNPTEPTSALNGQLVHVTGEVTTTDSITDPLFNIKVNALKLVRNVEMYQWYEEERRLTDDEARNRPEHGDYEYYYKKRWDSARIDSRKFKGPNAESNPFFKFSREKKFPELAKMGALKLSIEILDKMYHNETEPVTYLDSAKFSNAEITSSGVVHIGKGRSGDPEIGDHRVSFDVTRPGVFSVIARLDGETLVPYKTSNGRTINLVESDTASAEEMFENAKQSDMAMVWVLRVASAIVMMFGGMILFGLLGGKEAKSWVGSLTSLGNFRFSVMVAVSFSCISIGILWMTQHPRDGLAPMAAGLVLPLAVALLRRNRRAD